MTATEAESLRNMVPRQKGGHWDRPIAPVAGSRWRQFEKVSQSLISPLFKPAVSHFCRIAEEP